MHKSTMPVALVTGGARRIGAEIVSRLHQAGHNVVIHYRRSALDAEQLAHKLNQNRPDSACAVCAPLDGAADCERLMNESVSAWGRLDVLVNNASLFRPTPIGQVATPDIESLFNIHFVVPLYLAQAARTHLKNTQGVIINITDVHATHPMRDYAVYCASKASLQMLTLCLAKELAPEIRVSAVAPGLILWPEGDNALGDDTKELLMAKTALKKTGSATAVAEAVLSFIQNNYITGQVMAVDGGRFL